MTQKETNEKIIAVLEFLMTAIFHKKNEEIVDQLMSDKLDKGWRMAREIVNQLEEENGKDIL